jgi:hypothetical protein
MPNPPAFSRAFRLRCRTRRCAAERRYLKQKTSRARRRNYAVDIALEMDNVGKVREGRVPCNRCVI